MIQAFRVVRDHIWESLLGASGGPWLLMIIGSMAVSVYFVSYLT